MSRLLRRLSSKFSRSRNDGDDEDSRKVAEADSTSSSSPSRPWFKKRQSDIIGGRRSIEDSFAKTRSKTLRAWSNVSRMASYLSPKKYRKRSSASTSTGLDASDLEGSNTQEVSRSVSLMENDSRSLLSTSTTGYSLRSSQSEVVSPLGTTSEARKRRWDRRSQNRQLDSIWEGSQGEGGILEPGEESIPHKRSPKEKDMTMKTYDTLLQSSKSRSLLAANSTTDVPASSSNTSFETLPSKREKKQLYDDQSQNVIKITYISCPFKTPQKPDAGTDPMEGKPTRANTQITPENKIVPSPGSDVDPTRGYFQSPLIKPQIKTMNKIVEEVDIPASPFGYKSPATEKLRLPSRAKKPKSQTRSKLRRSSPRQSASRTRVSSAADEDQGTPQAKNPALARIKAELGSSCISIDDSIIGTKSQSCTESKSKTSNHKMPVQRSRSLDDMQQYDRYYNFLLNRENGDSKKIIQIFTAQLQVFQKEFSLKHSQLNIVPNKNIKPSVSESNISPDSSNTTAESMMEVSEYSLKDINFLDNSEISLASPATNVGDVPSTSSRTDVTNQDPQGKKSSVKSYLNNPNLSSGVSSSAGGDPQQALASTRLARLVSPVPFTIQPKEVKRPFFHSVTSPGLMPEQRGSDVTNSDQGDTINSSRSLAEHDSFRYTTFMSSTNNYSDVGSQSRFFPELE